jgi:hypothetical protein
MFQKLFLVKTYLKDLSALTNYVLSLLHNIIVVNVFLFYRFVVIVY